MTKLLSAVAVASVFLPSLSQAAIFVNDTGLTTYDTLVTFSTPALANGTIVTDQYAAQGLNFASTNGGAVRANGCGAGYFNPVVFLSGDTLATLGPGCAPNLVNDSFSIVFSNNLAAASFGFVSFREGGSNTLTAYLNGNAVGTIAHDSGSDSRGYLNITDVVFNEIRFTEPGSSQNYLIFDNLAYVNAAAVPEPTTVALLGLGLLGFAASRRKAAKK
jgi:hypothetical protein